jgi:hypothetical protein
MRLSFSGEMFYWRGPSPFHFVAVPEAQSEELAAVSSMVTYGWGCLPVRARVGATTWETSLFPKDGGYVVPLRVSVRRAEGLELGAVVDVTLDVDVAL